MLNYLLSRLLLNRQESTMETITLDPTQLREFGKAYAVLIIAQSPDADQDVKDSANAAKQAIIDNWRAITGNELGADNQAVLFSGLTLPS